VLRQSCAQEVAAGEPVELADQADAGGPAPHGESPAP
jgi:hypothetical protein